MHVHESNVIQHPEKTLITAFTFERREVRYSLVVSSVHPCSGRTYISSFRPFNHDFEDSLWECGFSRQDLHDSTVLAQNDRPLQTLTVFVVLSIALAGSVARLLGTDSSRNLGEHASRDESFLVSASAIHIIL